MKRRGMSGRESRSVYHRGADRVHRKNFVGITRGGYRL